MKLREYQASAVRDIKKVFAEKNNKIILQSATGSGKTIIFTHIAEAVHSKGKKVLIITDRKEMLTQAGSKLKNDEYLTAGVKKPPLSKIVVCMVETLKRRLKNTVYLDFLKTFDLIIIDEAHKASFDKILEKLDDKQFVIGATATPLRTGKMNPLSKYYSKIVNTIEISDLIEKKFLSKPRYYGVKIDLSGVRTTAGDYNSGDLGNKYNDSKLYEGVISNYTRHVPDTKTLIFSATIENSKNLCADFNRLGIEAKHLDSNMTDKNRATILREFKEQKFKVLCNVGILTTGFDDPDIQTVILYRATKSLPLYLQMVGRGSRVTDNKKEFTILDFGNNVANHGFWHEDRTWRY